MHGPGKSGALPPTLVNTTTARLRPPHPFACHAPALVSPARHLAAAAVTPNRQRRCHRCRPPRPTALPISSPLPPRSATMPSCPPAVSMKSIDSQQASDFLEDMYDPSSSDESLEDILHDAIETHPSVAARRPPSPPPAARSSAAPVPPLRPVAPPAAATAPASPSRRDAASSSSGNSLDDLRALLPAVRRAAGGLVRGRSARSGRR